MASLNEWLSLCAHSSVPYSMVCNNIECNLDDHNFSFYSKPNMKFINFCMVSKTRSKNVCHIFEPQLQLT